MKDSLSTVKDVTNDSVRASAVSSDKFDFAFFSERTGELGAETDEQKAEVAGISLSTYYRLKRGDANLTLAKLAMIAAKIGTTSARLLGDAA